jgi:hypothetical protein
VLTRSSKRCSDWKCAVEKVLSSHPLFKARLAELKTKAGEEYKVALEDTLRVLLVVAHRIRGKGPNDARWLQLLAITSDMKALAEAARGVDSPTMPASASPGESPPAGSSPPALTAEPGLGLRKFLAQALVAELGDGCVLPSGLPFCQISLVPPMQNSLVTGSLVDFQAGLQLVHLERIFEAEQARAASRAALPREVDSANRSCARQGCDIDGDLVVCKHAKHSDMFWCSEHAKHVANISVKRPQQ